MTTETKIPGLKVAHQIITPTCRVNRSNAGAIDEAVDRVAATYRRYAGDPNNAGVNWHLVLTRDAPDEV
ncbi:MAG: hypothetical protein Q8P46_15035 [Hyphomicrobiales bacterium]|nr:hypothetical protein [Hyphomicrobiales bacterium]